MAKTAEEIGLYNDIPPDATVDGFTEDPANPGWAEVSFSDGRTATLPLDHAQQLPQTPAAPIDPYGVPQGPPAPPAAAPAAPDYQVTAPGVDAPGQAYTEEQLLADVRGTSLPPAPGGEDLTGLQLSTPKVGTGAARVDPMAEIVSPGSAGGMAPYSEAESSSTTETTYAEDPADAMARVDEATAAQAGAERAFDVEARRAKLAGLDEEDEGLAAREAEVRKQLRQAELERQGHAKVIQAMEKTPIDEDEFWSGSPGRAAGAWIALALSGFLQGVTRGQNPALNQMVQALNHAQDRFVQTQRANRDSTLRAREKLMGDAKSSEDSFRLQLDGIMTKRIQNDAQRAGIPVPPGLETYNSKLAMNAAERKTAIGQRVLEQAQRQAQAEARATPATGPVRRGDVVLQQLGVDKKAHADAMDPKGLNMGGVVGGAERLQTVHAALEKIAARHGGSLPSQETVSWSSLGLAPQAARLGMDRGKDEISVKQLLEEAKLAYKQTVNIKSIDSENEGKNFNAIMDSGEGQSTLDAIRTRAEISNQNALSIASGVTRDAQGYVDFVRGTLHNSPGVQKGQQPAGFRALTPPRPRGETGAVQETTGGGPATGPLPTAGAQAATSLAAKAPETSTTGSRPGTYQRLRASKLGVPR